MKLKIGKTQYTVESVPTLPPKMSRGRITYTPVNTIEVTQYAHGKKRSDKAIRHTMWHEVVHGMLYEAGGPYRNEKLVDDIAKMIQQVNKQISGTLWNP